MTRARENRQRGTHEELSQDGGEAGETQAEEPCPEGVDGQRGVVLEGDETKSIVLLSLDRTLLTGRVEVDSTNIFRDLARAIGEQDGDRR